jgi:ABC-type nitrate/sulfonate/bicarbonate transport system substrate-binding protein
MRSTWRIPAIAACAALAVSACGGGGSAPPTSGGSNGGQTTLKVQETAGVPSAFVGFGMQKGFFAKHGLKIDLQTSQGGAATVPALVSGKIQNPDAVRRYRAAVGETARYLMAHRAEFRRFLSERAKTPPKLAGSMQLPTFTTKLNTASMQRTAGLVQRFGLVKQRSRSTS